MPQDTLQKNLVAAGLAESFSTSFYAIGAVETQFTCDAVRHLGRFQPMQRLLKVRELFDMRPAAIERD
jgi:S-adenosylmethionine synthetase